MERSSRYASSRFPFFLSCRHLSLEAPFSHCLKSHFIPWNFIDFLTPSLYNHDLLASSFMFHPFYTAFNKYPHQLLSTLLTQGLYKYCLMLMEYYLRSSTYDRNPFHLESKVSGVPRISHFKQKQFEKSYQYLFVCFSTCDLQLN